MLVLHVHIFSRIDFIQKMDVHGKRDRGTRETFSHMSACTYIHMYAQCIYMYKHTHTCCHGNIR